VRSTRRRAAVGALCAIVAVVGIGIVPPADVDAQTTTTASPGNPSSSTSSSTTTTTTTVPRDPTAPGVSLVAQPPWIPTQGVEVLGLQLDDPAIADVEDAAVEITVHRSVTSRSEFDRAISGEELPGVRARMLFPFSTLGVNRAGRFGIVFGLSGSGAERAVAVEDPGVYPIEVGVVDAGDERTTFVTWMVVVDPDRDDDAQPLRFSWIWGVPRPTARWPSTCSKRGGATGSSCAKRRWSKGR